MACLRAFEFAFHQGEVHSCGKDGFSVAGAGHDGVEGRTGVDSLVGG